MPAAFILFVLIAKKDISMGFSPPLSQVVSYVSVSFDYWWVVTWLLKFSISMQNGCNDMNKLFFQSVQLREAFILVGRGNDKNLKTSKINSAGDKCYRKAKKKTYWKLLDERKGSGSYFDCVVKLVDCTFTP